MKRCLAIWLALTVLGPACTSGGGGDPASLPFGPFGVEPAPVVGAGEPTSGNDEAPATSGGTIQELCGQACVKLAAAFGQQDQVGACASNCVAAQPPGCEAEFRAFVSCLAMAGVSCAGGRASAPQCDLASSEVSSCRAASGGI